jgi:hypothetical protein
VTTKRFNEQIRRNLRRFPADFMFRLDTKEASFLRSQNATLVAGRGRYSKYAPLAFTEHGAIMAATILNSSRAVEMSIFVVSAFVRLRDMLASNVELAQRFAELERRLGGRIAEHDEIIGSILAAVRGLMAPVVGPQRGIGFTADIGSGGPRVRGR